MARARTFEYGGSARTSGWYATKDTDIFVCSCGWQGTFEECAVELHSELADGSCQACRTMLIVRGLPTPDETRAAAAQGDPRARRDLPDFERNEARATREGV